MRYFIEIAYKGTQYSGWQKQPKATTVQGVLDNCLSKLLRQSINTMGAGRTDAGVHAIQLYAHFDCDEIEDTVSLINRLNGFLPIDISAINLYEVAPEAHARFDAISRSYAYYISTVKNPFTRDIAYQLYEIPDMELMNEAAKSLMDYKDFQCFSRSKTDVKTYNCTIEYAYWERQGDQLIFYIKADRFLRNMVRAVVGTLLAIGLGNRTHSDFIRIIEAKDRKQAGVSAPACGLFLTQVNYPEGILNKREH